MNPASSLRINAQKFWLGTNGPKSTWNQSPLNLPGIHALRICQDSWPKTNTLKVFWESMLPKFYMDPMPPVCVKRTDGPGAKGIAEASQSWVKVLEMEPMRSINRKQVCFFMDHCVILWEIPQRQNQYFKRDQNAVNHHTQTSFSLPWNFSQKCTQHENHWTTLLTY